MTLISKYLNRVPPEKLPVGRTLGKDQRKPANTRSEIPPLAEQPLSAKREVPTQEIIDAIKTQITAGNSDLEEIRDRLAEQFPDAKLPIPWIGLQRARARKELGITEEMDDVKLGVGINPRERPLRKELVRPARMETEEELLSNIIPILRSGVAVGVPIGTPAEREVDAEKIISQFAHRLVKNHAWLKLPQFIQTLADLLSVKFPFNGSRDHRGYFKISLHNAKRYAGLEHDAKIDTKISEETEEDVHKGKSSDEIENQVAQSELDPKLIEEFKKEIRMFLASGKGSNQEIMYALIKGTPGVLISSDEVSEWINEILSSDSALREQRNAKLDDQELRSKVAEEVARGGLDELRKRIKDTLEEEIKADPRAAFLNIYASRISRRLGLDISTERVNIFLYKYVSREVQELRENALRGADAASVKQQVGSEEDVVGRKQTTSAPREHHPTESPGPSNQRKKRITDAMIGFLNASDENLTASHRRITAHVNKKLGLKLNGEDVADSYSHVPAQLRKRRSEALAARRLIQKNIDSSS